MSSKYPKTYDGKITLFLGAMRSSKSDNLIMYLRKAQFAGRKVIGIKPEKDTVHLNIESRSGEKFESYSVKNILDINFICMILSNGYDLIAIDEGHFVEHLKDFCVLMASYGKHVLVSALNGTFSQTTFSSINKLLPFCTQIIKTEAYCMGQNCKNDADFSFLLDTNILTASFDGEYLPGDEQFESLCFKCLMERRGKNELEKSVELELLKY